MSESLVDEHKSCEAVAAATLSSLASAPTTRVSDVAAAARMVPEAKIGPRGVRVGSLIRSHHAGLSTWWPSRVIRYDHASHYLVIHPYGVAAHRRQELMLDLTDVHVVTDLQRDVMMATMHDDDVPKRQHEWQRYGWDYARAQREAYAAHRDQYHPYQPPSSVIDAWSLFNGRSEPFTQPKHCRNRDSSLMYRDHRDMYIAAEHKYWDDVMTMLNEYHHSDQQQLRVWLKNNSDAWDYTLLMYAARDGQFACVKRLLKYGCDPNGHHEVAQHLPLLLLTYHIAHRNE